MKNSKCKGVALVMVLALLVLLSAIVIAFLSSVTTDVAASKSYESQTNARELADSAVNLVISQIRKASTSPTDAWISQPGLLRTFDSGGQTGAYKLYSSDKLFVAGKDWDPADLDNGDLPGDSSWSISQRGVWTDINAPVVYKDKDNAEQKIYPILDVDAITGPDGTIPDVDGFAVQNFGTYKTAGLMPVRWLYMLQDGTLLPATGGGDEVTVEGTVSADNPIIARIAFWTDDETCKLNINTASEGVFWDTPVANSQAPPGFPVNVKNMFEMDMAANMPASREYQRFPGHPATTSLYPVIGPAVMKANGISNPNATLIPSGSWAAYVEAMYQIVPRVSGAPESSPGVFDKSKDVSSRGGTKRAGLGSLNGGQEMSYNNNTYAVANDADRLFATVDELFFDPTRQKQKWLSSSSSVQNGARALVERSKFFLTASSKAPEQNVFNMPRVSIWPITIDSSSPFDTKKMTPYDKLFAFCSTVGSNESGGDRVPFYFTRRNPNSMSDDWNIGSNQDIYDYLMDMCSKSFPSAKGGEGKFTGKYGSNGMGQIITEMFDYVRCTNLVDTSDDGSDPTRMKNLSPTDTKSYTTPDSLTTEAGPARGWRNGAANRGQVLPITTKGDQRGFGRVATISEFALVICYDDRATAGYDPVGKLNAVPPVQPQVKIQAAIIPNMYCPMAGFSALANNLRITFGHISGLQVSTAGQTIAFKEPYYSIHDNVGSDGRFSSTQSDESKVGGDIGVKTFVETPNGTAPVNAGAPTDSNFPVAESAVFNGPYDTSTKDVAISEGTVDVYITYPGNVPYDPGSPPKPGQALLQKIQLRFPAISGLPRPTKSNGFYAPSNPSKANSNRYGSRGTFPIKDQDIVRSLVPTGAGVAGDMRVIACMGTVPMGVFQPHLYYSNPSKTQAMSIMGTVPGRGVINGATEGSFLAVPVAAAPDLKPYVPVGDKGINLSGVHDPDSSEIGDWDNGPHFLMDGSYLNKADEGTAGHTHAGGTLASDRPPYIGQDYVGEDAGSEQGTFFSPNRMLASPVAFGSLPTGVTDSKGWRTLLFRPAIPGILGGDSHPGFKKDPPDHRLLDLFWMPVVEPYAISEPFATSGKINMNYQIAPFSYIKRATGILGVMRAVKVTAINPNQNASANGSVGSNYKKMGNYAMGDGGSGGVGVQYRRDIDAINTLKFFEDDHFKKGVNLPFVTESEICTIPLIPQNVQNLGGHATITVSQYKLGVEGSGESAGAIRSKLGSFWRTNTLTGDNSLERPYAMLYPRLTTRSNTYTVHVKVQTLKKRPISVEDANKFNDKLDQVTGEFRGSFVIERYLDPTTQTFNIRNPDTPLEPYKFRVVSSKQFVQ